MTDRMNAILKKIPVFPEFGRLEKNFTLASELLIIEDDNGHVAWVSEEAKRDAIRKPGRTQREHTRK